MDKRHGKLKRQGKSQGQTYCNNRDKASYRDKYKDWRQEKLYVQILGQGQSKCRATDGECCRDRTGKEKLQGQI